MLFKNYYWNNWLVSWVLVYRDVTGGSLHLFQSPGYCFISSVFPSFQRWWEKASISSFLAVLSVASFGLWDDCFLILLRSAAPVFTCWVIFFIRSLKKSSEVGLLLCVILLAVWWFGTKSLAFFFFPLGALLVRKDSRPEINS